MPLSGMCSFILIILLLLMDIILAFKALIMGMVEGLTEFLPVSSTGHLILAGNLINFSSDTFTKEKIDMFEVVIQAGSILAVCWEYRSRLIHVLSTLFSDRLSMRLAINLIVAFMPAAIIGLLLHAKITELLFSPVPVACALVIGGLIMMWVERRNRRNHQFVRVATIDDMSVIDAFKVGCAQILALIPGTSRSGSTIVGGMIFGLSRKAATEFSFFLAIPTLFAATIYSFYKSHDVLASSELSILSIGSISAFISAFICVRWLLRYISTHDFMPFAWYRIIFGIIILITSYTGIIAW